MEVNDQIRCKNSILRSSLHDYSSSYIFVKGTLIKNKASEGASNNAANKK